MHEALGGSQAPCKLGTLVHTCNLRVWEIPAEGSEIQRYPWLCILFKTSLYHTLSSLSETERERVYILVLKQLPSCWQFSNFSKEVNFRFWFPPLSTCGQYLFLWNKFDCVSQSYFCILNEVNAFVLERISKHRGSPAVTETSKQVAGAAHPA